MALVAIVSLMLVAFVTAMRQDRTATYSYSQSLSTEQVARGGLQLVVNELRRELARDRLPDYGTGNYTNNPIFTNLATANIMPQANVTNSAIPTLIKISNSNPFFTGNLSQSPLRASTLSSTTPSINGRAISLARWGRPYFGNFTTTASAPYWVYMTRGGVTNALGISVSTSGNTNSLNNRLASNTNYAIGRFAYAIYDQGGLLDITVAGHRNNLTALEYNQLKGTLAGADLRVITNGAGVQLIDPDALVAWRNKTTGVSAATYLNYVTNFASTNGFRKVYPGDTTFLSRQDLIKAALNNSAGFNTNALPVLTTFTREKNAPSWGPTTNVGGAYNYATLSLNPSSTNRLTTLVRYTATASGTHYRSDGSSYSYNIKPGDPAIRSRFPLDRLKWLTPSGPDTPDTAKAAAIQACFGLRWDTTQDSNLTGAKVWRYVGNTGTSAQNSIKTLDTVANENREPNFFELLQAAILRGSLGVNGGSAHFPSTHQVNSMLQIFRIGACIIDQYDRDSVPTVVEFRSPASTPWQACGVESLPYINFIKDFVGTSPDSPTDSFAGYCAIGLWNPHQNATIPSLVPRVRIRAQGAVGMINYFATSALTGTPAWLGTGGYIAYASGIVQAELSSAGIQGYSNPGILTPSAISSGIGNPAGAALGWSLTPSTFDGYGLPRSSSNPPPYATLRYPDLKLDLSAARTSTASAARTAGADATRWGIVSTLMSAGSPLQFTLEYFQTSTSTWIPYNYLSGINDTSTWMQPWIVNDNPFWNGNTQLPASTSMPGYAFDKQESWGRYATSAVMTTDPRVLRLKNFEIYISSASSVPASSIGLGPLWATSMKDSAYQVSGYGGSTHVTPYGANPQIGQAPTIFGSASSPATFFFPATLSHNAGTSVNSGFSGNSVYPDPDGVVRMADSGLFSLSASTGNPYQRTADRPVMLNRPFQSVAELGYVLRDAPWKTLDLFSKDSADAGLLDLFCLTEAPFNTVASGRVNLNTRNKLVLKSILTGILTDVPSASGTLGDPDAIAQAIVDYTNPANAAGGPFSNKSEFVAKFIGSATVLPDSKFGSPDEAKIKGRREAIARTLLDVGQTRTWNLLIDIVTQTGKYPPNATTMDQFMVDGERRYWLHIAIDRVTGEIVDQQLETVIE